MASVTFAQEIGGSGITISDDEDPKTGLAGGGHRTRFVPALQQTVAVAHWLVEHLKESRRLNQVATDVSQQARVHADAAVDAKRKIEAIDLTTLVRVGQYGLGKGWSETDVVARGADLFPKGTRLLFAQKSAPVGWVQVKDDGADNRMLRVVKTAGAAVGGKHSPILNSVVPAHTHTFTTGEEEKAHTHLVDGETGHESVGHSHSGQTDVQGGHTHTVEFQRGQFPVQFTFGEMDGGFVPNESGHTGHAGQHQHNFTSGGANTKHTHHLRLTSGVASTRHTHAGTTDPGSSRTNWTPRYLDLILCEKC